MVRARPNPSAWAACTNSRSRSESTSPRTSRAVPGHCVSPSTAMIRKIEGSKSAMIVISSTSCGKEITMSTSRMITESTQPPKNPDTAPSSVPIVTLIPTATKPIERETRAP